MPCCQGQNYDQMFDARQARRELRTYARRGPKGATKRLLSAISDWVGRRGESWTLLDVGGGVGVLQHELAARGFSRITAVDASAPYLELLASEAKRRGYGSRHQTIAGDMVDVAARVPPCSLVTLDKVLCCYPHVEELVHATASRATRLYGVVVPRDAAWVRWGSRVGNWLMAHVLRWEFRSFVHAHRTIDGLCRREGLELCRQEAGLFWSVRLYHRRTPAPEPRRS